MSSVVQLAWSSLSTALRLYAESHMRFDSLFSVDQEEAITNHDSALLAKLEAFHTFYDVTKEIASFEYFDHGDTSLLITLRNALHHRDHTLFVSWNALLHREGLAGLAGAEFLMATYQDIPASASKAFFVLQDFMHRLSDPRVRGAAQLKKMWGTELHFFDIAARGQAEQYPASQVYVDVMPVFISAMQRVAQWLAQEKFIPAGYDAEVYYDFFLRKSELTLKAPSYSVLRIPPLAGDPAR